MGYHTDFEGSFAIRPQLEPDHAEYLRLFAGTRRMQRDAAQLEKVPDPNREVVHLPVGPDGAFFVAGGGFAGQEKDGSVVDYDTPPAGQPGLWCQWVPSEDGSSIQWDGNEKFYYYVEWLEYIIATFLAPWGYTLAGRVRWTGEDVDDHGTIRVSDNVVSVEEGPASL